MFITYAVSNIAGISNMPDKKFVQDDKSYLQISQQMTSVDDYLMYESDPSVEYLLPGDGKINMTLPFDQYWQTSYSSARFSGSLSSVDKLTDGDLICGYLCTEL